MLKPNNHFSTKLSFLLLHTLALVLVWLCIVSLHWKALHPANMSVATLVMDPVCNRLLHEAAECS